MKMEASAGVLNLFGKYSTSRKALLLKQTKFLGEMDGTYFETAPGAELIDDADVSRIDTGPDESVDVVVGHLFQQLQFLTNVARDFHVLFLQGPYSHHLALEKGKGSNHFLKKKEIYLVSDYSENFRVTDLEGSDLEEFIVFGSNSGFFSTAIFTGYEAEPSYVRLLLWGQK